MARRPVLSLLWRGVSVVGLAALIVSSGVAAVLAGWAVVTKAANLGDKVVWGGFALLCAGYAAWNTRILLGVLGLGRGKGADA